MPSYPFARYTMSFLEFRTENEEALLEVFDDWSEARVNNLCKMLGALYDNYEISGETVGEELMFLGQVFNQHQGYYSELLNKYDEDYQISLRDMTKKVVDTSRRGTSHSEGISVDLPNKKISEDNIYAYPDSGDKNTSGSSSSGQTITDDKGALLSLRKEYLDQVRNIYEEFAYRFSDCFLHLYF